MSDIEPGTVKINVYVEDKIGLPNYSSVTIGGSITRIVPEGDADVLSSEFATNFELVEKVLAVERAKVLGEIQEK